MTERTGTTESAAAVVLTTVDSEQVAEALAVALVEARLAACVQVLPVTSHYRWQGRLERTAELLLLAKTTGRRAADVQDWLRRHHPYDVPEILAVPASVGGAEYLLWLADQTG